MSVSMSRTPFAARAEQPPLGVRLQRMCVVWAALGAVMGASVGLQGGGLIGAVAGTMAGTLELAILGAIFAAIGGRPGETIVGSVAGLAVALAFGFHGVPAPLVLVANFGMIVGAIGGATLRAYVRLASLPIMVLGRAVYELIVFHHRSRS